MQSLRFEKRNAHNKILGCLVTGLIEMMMDIKIHRQTEKLKCIEIGSHIGESALIMSSFHFIEKFYCIEIKEDRAKVISERLRHIKDKVEIYNESSKTCHNKFTDASVDMIYIDTLHDYKNTKEHLELYAPKVKRGGFICGHDYHFTQKLENINGVKKAVDEFMEQYRLKQLMTYRDSSFCIIKESTDQKIFKD